MRRKQIGTGSALLILVFVVLSPGIAQEAEETATASGTAGARDRLEGIREDLVQLKLEKALAAIDALLSEPGLSADETAEAWVLRSQAHVAFGDLDAVEEDYREILARRPGFEPETSLTTPKALERFERVQKAMVGHVKVSLSPSDATLVVDGEPVSPDSSGTVAVRAGSRILSANRSGYDPFEQVLEVEAGKVVDLPVQLVPNARTVVVHTDVEGVAVLVDGRSVGETVRTGRGQLANAILVIEDVPLGEHTFELAKPCYRTRKTTEILTVDVLDPTPLDLPPVRMQASRAALRVLGEPEGAEVLVDGEAVGSIPIEHVPVCPGERVLEVRAASATVFLSTRTIREDETVDLDVAPRPNAVLVGAEDWPADLDGLASGVNTLDVLPLPAGADLENPEGWKDVRLADDVHLAVAVLPPVADGAPERWLAFSPTLQLVDRVDRVPGHAARPSWYSNALGMSVADSELGGTSVVVRVVEGSPAAAAGIKPGERVLGVNGSAVPDAAAVADAVAGTAPGSEIVLEIEGAETRNVTVAGEASPRIVPVGTEAVERILLAAWAEQSAVAFPSRSAAPLANLATQLTQAGRDRVAAETWRRVRWGDRRGIGEGTRAYYLGRALMKIGREDEAIEWFRKAAASTSTTFSDYGPPVAAAAEDHLVDLGVSMD